MVQFSLCSSTISCYSLNLVPGESVMDVDELTVDTSTSVVSSWVEFVFVMFESVPLIARR